MFCGKCGTQNPENAAFCKKCGTPLANPRRQSGTATIQTNVTAHPKAQQSRPTQKKNTSHKKVGKIAVIAIIVIVLIAGFALFGGRSYKSTIKQFVNAQFDVDAASIFRLIPDKMIDYMLEESGYEQDDMDDLIEDANDSIRRQISSIERYLGKDWKFSYKITSIESVGGNDLKSLKKDYKKMGVNVSAAKVAKVELTVKVGETESSNSMEIPLIKVGRSWYLDVDSMGNLF